MESRVADAGVVLTFRNGEKMRTSLSAPFRPQEDVVKVFISPTEKRVIPFDDLCCISTSGSRLHHRDNGAAGAVRDVELVTGERFFIRTRPDQVCSNGFFGISAKQSAPSESFFIISSALRPPGHTGVSAEGGVPGRGSAAGLVDSAAGAESVSPSPGHALPERLTQPASQERRIGEILIREGYVTREQVENAVQGGEKGRIGKTLIKQRLISEAQLLMALATKFGSRYVDLSEVRPDANALEALSRSVVNRMKVLPLQLEGRKLVVATSEPTDLTISDDLSFITRYQIELVAAPSAQIAAAIDRFYNNVTPSIDSFITELADEQAVLLDTSEEDTGESDSKVISLVNRILIEAFQKNVSDVHLEPKLFKGPLVVRYRIDGECVLCHEIPTIHKNAIISRLKVMAKLDISERRKPQSGKIYLQYQKRRLEYRLEVTPTVGEQEDAVLRLLTTARPLLLTEMGLSQANLAKFDTLLRKPYGMILCVGPTGSGKTTTLHSALASINSVDRKIWTAEDPVEIIQDGLRQVQVNPRIGYGFEVALRSFLRADPDVIMIGEMRDLETTRTAVAASLTGHLVFSTLHTNSAPETVGRLLEMGLDPFNFADALQGVIAQRLARKLCDHCKEAYHPAEEEYEQLVLSYGERWFKAHGLPKYSDSLRLNRSKGCDHCFGSGYKGRIAIHELLLSSPAISKAIKHNLPVEELRELALQEGMTTLKMDGILKVFEGVTDLQHVQKVCML